MANTFQFKNNRLTLRLCEKVCTIEISEKTLNICDQIRSDAKKYLSELKQSDNDSAISDICLFFEKSIDRLLGDGITKEIFGKRALSLLDLTDLLSYILSRISSAIAERTISYGEDLE